MKKESLSFEAAFSQLERTVEALEAGGLALEEATRLFEEGMRLAKLCNQHLDTVELKITQLQTSYGEQMKLLGNQSEPQ